MTQTGPASFNPDGSHTHTIPAPPPALAAPPNLPKECAIGTGSQGIAWAQGILSAMGAPQTQANINSLVGWFAMEDNHAKVFGTPANGAGGNNPLNVTAMSGTFAGVVGSEPSGAGAGHPGNLDFDTPAHGIAATVTVIRNYSAINSALMSGAGLIGNAQVASNLATWSGNGYSAIIWPV